MKNEFPENDTRARVCQKQWDGDATESRQLWATFEARSVDDEKRIIEGIATTSEEALDGLILETRGIEFKLPIPFLYNHDTSHPLGNVISADVKNDRINVRIQVAPQGTSEFIDEKWRMIKAGIVRGLSIKFRMLKAQANRVLKSLWLELSAVALPADLNASIISVRSADEAILRAIANKGTRDSVVRLNRNPSGAPVQVRNKGTAMKTIAEQITELEGTVLVNEKRIDELIAAADGRSFEEHEDAEIKDKQAENKRWLDKITLLKSRNATLLQKAAEVTPENTDTPAKAAATRGGPQEQARVISVRSNLPKGTTFSRWVMATVEAKNDMHRAADLSKTYWPDQPELEQIFRTNVGSRAQVLVGTTTHATWASPLIPAAQTMFSEFLELLRPLSIIGRIPNLTRVPPNVVVPIQTGGGTGNWVGETQAKPVSALAFTSATLRWAKAVVMTVLSEELIRYSSPSAEAVVRSSIAKDIAQYLDTQFISTTIESVNVSPAGLLWNAPTSAATGVTAATFLTDFKTALATFIAANYDLSQLVILMSSTVALNVSTLKDSLGNFLYPTLGLTGGTVLNIPVVVSEAVGNKIIFMNASEILLADDGGIMIDASNQASILMDDAPNASPATTSLVSLYQRNLVAIKCEQYITWKKARSTSVYYLSNASYTG